MARKADFSDVITETLLSTNVIELPELDNGGYFVKVRGIDDLGLEGKDSTGDLVLNLPTAPAAPAPAAPAAEPAPAAPAAPAN